MPLTDYETLADLIRAAYPAGPTETEGAALYNALAGGRVLLVGGRDLHASWRGVGSQIVEAGGPGTYLDYYLGFGPLDEQTTVAARKRLLRVDEVAAIECFPRGESMPYYPRETMDASHPSGWAYSVRYTA